MGGRFLCENDERYAICKPQLIYIREAASLNQRFTFPKCFGVFPIRFMPKGGIQFETTLSKTFFGPKERFL